MTQDISRSFLAGSNDKSDRKKFDIYMEATLLAHSQENYQVRTVMRVRPVCDVTKNIAMPERLRHKQAIQLQSAHQ